MNARTPLRYQARRAAAVIAAAAVPAGGWTDASGYETGDKCAWITPGTPGGAAGLALPTGTFAMQSTWANDAGGCEFSHPIVSNG